MKDSNQHNLPQPWKKPQIKTLSISRDTEQEGPKNPPDYEPQVS